MGNRCFYINANFNEKYFLCYGMEFNDFIKSNSVELNNILITDGSLSDSNFNSTWLLDTVNGAEAIKNLADEDLYSLGNFCWIDYDNEVNLDNCTPEEKAEVLYLKHFLEPLKSASIDTINNSFVYLSHDDGWYCKLYCRDILVFEDIISKRIINRFSGKKKRKIHPMPEEIKKEIFELTKAGLMLDFLNISRSKKEIKLDFYIIGQYEDMDTMYDDFEHKKATKEVAGTIEYRNKTWAICHLNRT